MSGILTKDNVSEIRDVLEKAGIENEIKVLYEDIADGGFGQAAAGRRRKESKETGILGDAKAFVSGGKLDWNTLRERTLLSSFAAGEKAGINCIITKWTPQRKKHTDSFSTIRGAPQGFSGRRNKSGVKGHHADTL